MKRIAVMDIYLPLATLVLCLIILVSWRQWNQVQRIKAQARSDAAQKASNEVVEAFYRQHPEYHGGALVLNNARLRETIMDLKRSVDEARLEELQRVSQTPEHLTPTTIPSAWVAPIDSRHD